VSILVHTLGGNNKKLCLYLTTALTILTTLTTPGALLVVDSNERVLTLVKKFEEITGTVGMHASWSKSKIQHLGAGTSDRSVTIGGAFVENVDEFVYLGSLNSGFGGVWRM